MVMTLNISAMKAYLARKEQHSLAVQPGVALALKDKTPPVALFYCNMPDLFDAVYPWCSFMANVAAGESQKQGIDLDPTFWPSAPAIRAHLRPEITSIQRSPHGLEFTSRYSLPTGGLTGLLMLTSIGAASGTSTSHTFPLGEQPYPAPGEPHGPIVTEGAMIPVPNSPYGLQGESSPQDSTQKPFGPLFDELFESPAATAKPAVRPAPPPAPAGKPPLHACDGGVRSTPAHLSHLWCVFNDPVLNDLLNHAHAQNLTLKQAGARILQVRAQLDIARGDLFPQSQAANGSVTANEASTNTNILNAHKHFQNWDFNCKLAWELDFWDRFRRAVNAHDDHLDFSVEDYDAALVTLIDDVATNYVTVRQAQQQIAMAKQNVLLQTEVLKITRVFFEHGRASALDLEKAQATLSQTRATIPDFEITLRQSQDALCTLLGIPPEDLQARLGNGPIPGAASHANSSTVPVELRGEPLVEQALENQPPSGEIHSPYAVKPEEPAAPPPDPYYAPERPAGEKPADEPKPPERAPTRHAAKPGGTTSLNGMLYKNMGEGNLAIPYLLLDRYGVVVGYLAAGPGVDLESHLGQVVTVQGKAAASQGEPHCLTCELVRDVDKPAAPSQKVPLHRRLQDLHDHPLLAA